MLLSSGGGGILSNSLGLFLQSVSLSLGSQSLSLFLSCVFSGLLGNGLSGVSLSTLFSGEGLSSISLSALLLSLLLGNLGLFSLFGSDGGSSFGLSLLLSFDSFSSISLFVFLDGDGLGDISLLSFFDGFDSELLSLGLSNISLFVFLDGDGLKSLSLFFSGISLLSLLYGGDFGDLSFLDGLLDLLVLENFLVNNGNRLFNMYSCGGGSGHSGTHSGHRGSHCGFALMDSLVIFVNFVRILLFEVDTDLVVDEGKDHTVVERNE